MEKPDIFAVVSYDDDGTTTSIFFDRDEAVKDYEDTHADGKVVGQIKPGESFGQGAHSDWYGIDIIHEEDQW